MPTSAIHPLPGFASCLSLGRRPFAIIYEDRIVMVNGFLSLTLVGDTENVASGTVAPPFDFAP